MIEIYRLSKHFAGQKGRRGDGEKGRKGERAKISPPLPLSPSSRRGEGEGVVRAVDRVTLTLQRGRTMGLIGESGSGKTTLGLVTVRLLDPTEGQVILRLSEGDAVALSAVPEGDLRQYRKYMQMIFQNQNAALPPRGMRARDILCQAIRVRGELKRQGSGAEPRTPDIEREVRERLARVRLGEDKLDRFPYELSGGERRRLILARALCIEPAFLVADEITSDLDGPTALGVLNLIKEIQREQGLTCLFISHDLPSVLYVSHEIAVMYQGRIVEVGPAVQILESPRHPYTQSLIALLADFGQAESDCGSQPRTIPWIVTPPWIADCGGKSAIVRLSAHDEVRNPQSAIPLTGCPYAPECPRRTELCRQRAPVLEPIEGPGQGGPAVACHHWNEA